MASLKEQLDQAGYDTSSLDETAVLKQLNDAGYDTSSFTSSDSPSILGMLGDVTKKLLPSKETLEAPMKASEHLGKMVEAGGAGIGDIDAAILPRMGNFVANQVPFVKHDPFQEPAMDQSVMQAGKDVNAVMNGLAPETKAGKAGKFIGSFFTPNQIAMTAAGEGLIAPVLKGLGKAGTVANKIGEVMAPATETELPGAMKAAGNAISTISGLGTPEVETVMSHGKDVVNAAKSFPQLAEDVAGSMNKLTDHIGNLEKASTAVLDASKTIKTSLMEDAIQSELKSIKMSDVTTPGMENAEKVLKGMIDKMANKGTMTEPEVAKWVKNVQSKINWNDPLGTELNEALTHVQDAVNGALKAQNPAYEKAIGHFADAVNLKNDLTKAMGIEKATGLGGSFEPTNVAVTKLKGLLNPDSALQTKKLLTDFSKVPGVPNYTKMAQNSAAKAALGQGMRARLGGVLAGLVPTAGNAIKAGVTSAVNTIPAVPSAVNAIYQGLTQ